MVIRSWDLTPGDTVVLVRGQKHTLAPDRSFAPWFRADLTPVRYPSQHREVVFRFRTTALACFDETGPDREPQLVQLHLTEEGGLRDRDGWLWSITKAGALMHAAAGVL